MISLLQTLTGRKNYRAATTGSWSHCQPRLIDPGVKPVWGNRRRDKIDTLSRDGKP